MHQIINYLFSIFILYLIYHQLPSESNLEKLGANFDVRKWLKKQNKTQLGMSVEFFGRKNGKNENLEKEEKTMPKKKFIEVKKFYIFSTKGA